MKLSLIRLIVFATLTLGSLRAVEINFTSPAFEIGKTSTDDLLTSGFNFTLGSFGSFVPNGGNLSQWKTNFVALETTAWDEDFSQFSGTATLSNNTAPFTAGSQAYIWGYNTDLVGAGSQWVLFTNTNWTFPTSGTVLPISWDTTDAGTVASFGFLAPSLGADPYIQTASAVPEPSIAATLIGMGALAFGMVKRRKKGALQPLNR